MKKNPRTKKTATKKVRQTNESAVIAVMAFVLTVSFFSVERFTGAENEAHGQSMYGTMQMPSGYQSPLPSAQSTRKARASSAAAKRAERRSAKAGVPIRPSCNDKECNNLLSDFAAGSSMCLKVSDCVKALNLAVSSKYCSNNSTCTLLRALKDFYATSPDCVQNSSPICEYDVRRIILLAK